jgi:hypothetical protein
MGLCVEQVVEISPLVYASPCWLDVDAFPPLTSSISGTLCFRLYCMLLLRLSHETSRDVLTHPFTQKQLVYQAIMTRVYISVRP